MAAYKDRKNYVPHSINNVTVTIDGEHKIEGLELFEAEMDEDEVTVQTVADGTGILVENPSRAGQIRIQFLEAGASSDKMYELLEGREVFSISALDVAAPNFDVHGNYCRVMKRPVITRGREAGVPEWVFVSVYLDIKGGSYALATA